MVGPPGRGGSDMSRRRGPRTGRDGHRRYPARRPPARSGPRGSRAAGRRICPRVARGHAGWNV